MNESNEIGLLESICGGILFGLTLFSPFIVHLFM